MTTSLTLTPDTADDVALALYWRAAYYDKLGTYRGFDLTPAECRDRATALRALAAQCAPDAADPYRKAA